MSSPVKSNAATPNAVMPNPGRRDELAAMPQPENARPESAAKLLAQVRHRMTAAAFGRACFVWGIVSISVAILVVLAARLLGVIPPTSQRLEWLAAFPVAALLLAAVSYRRVLQAQAARRIDQHAGTHDLYLTLSTLSTSAGDYQPLVAQAAENTAVRIRPDDVVPFQAGRRLSWLTLSAVALAVLIGFTPQLDPFGKVEAATKVIEQKKELASIRKATKARQDQLKKDAETEDERAEMIDKQIEGMKSAFRQMKPKEQQSNSKVLQSNRNALNDQWKMVSTEDLRKMLSEQALSQQFGGARGQKLNEWLKDLQQGKTEALQKQMDEVKETMQAMMEAKTPEDRQKLASELRRQLQDMKKFATEKANSGELASALDKALKALDAAAKPEGQNGEPGEEMSKEAMEALQESLELSKAELQELARSAKDLKKLEEALKTLQQAERLNQKGQLDGEQCENCNSLAEYAEMYKKMMAGMPGEGEGMGEKGFGKGGEAPEDDSDPEGYKTEKSKSQIQAGKVLLSIKTKEYASEKDFDPNEHREYKESVTAIKSGVQAAIEAEQVPPGYVDGIKGYFDKLDAAAPSTKP